MQDNLAVKRKLKENFSWVFVINLIIGLINFFTAIFFARHLGPSIMGDYATIIVSFELTFSFLSFGFNQFVISKKYEDDSYNVALTAIVFQSVFLVILFCLFFFVLSFIEPQWTSHFIVPLFLIMCSKILSLFNLMFYSKLETEFNYKKISTSRFVSTILGLGFAYTWFFLFADLYTLILRDFTVAVIFITITYSQVKPELKLNFNRSSFKELWKFSSSMWVLNFLEHSITRLDYALVGFLAGKDSLGIYFTVRNIVEGLLGFILNPVQTVLLSYYTKLRKTSGYFLYLIKKISIIYIPLAFAFTLLVWLLKDFAITTLLGLKYRTGDALLTGFAIYFFSIIWFENIKVFTMSERIHSRMILPRIMQIIGYSSIIFPLYNVFGFWGAGFATGFAALILTSVATLTATRYFNTQKL
ncbi:MAG: oligosaccharide flippase family protein [Ignavibacteriales bacterium]|nr:MAG: oligosaccharide flippase family protein [Ignavibacteriales bacterium]